MEILDNAYYLNGVLPRKISFGAGMKVLFDDYTVQIGTGTLAVGLIFKQNCLLVNQNSWN